MPADAIAPAAAMKLTIVGQVGTGLAVLAALGLFVLAPDAETSGTAPLVATSVAQAAAEKAAQLSEAIPAEPEQRPVDVESIAFGLSMIANAPKPDDEPEPSEVAVTPVEPAETIIDDFAKLYSYLGMVAMTNSDGTARRLAVIRLNNSGTQRILGEGADLGDGVVLRGVDAGEITLERDGETRSMAISERTGPRVTSSSTQQAVSTPQIPQRGQDESDESRARRAEDLRQRALERARNRNQSPQSRLGAEPLTGEAAIRAWREQQAISRDNSRDSSDEGGA